MPTIVYAPVMENDVRAIADRFLPAGFNLLNVSAAQLPEAVAEADFLCGFIGPIETDVLV
ncbi:MAG: hypothetical protein JOY61_18445, partial [Chloroflexi bacterium]|nr:hypothetical protein [Chloroflexota bacterium]